MQIGNFGIHAVTTKILSHDVGNNTRHMTENNASGTQLGGHLPPEIFKALHSNFDICRNFQRIKMKFFILMFFKKSYWNFSLPCPVNYYLLTRFILRQVI